MPSKTAKQHRFMEAIAHNKSFAKKVGVPQSVGKDFVEADKGKKFAAGGMGVIGKQNARHGKTDLPFTKLNRFAGMKAGGNVKRYAGGGELERLGEAGESQSFGQAFKDARASGAGTFTWRGKKYNTEVAKGGAKSAQSPNFIDRLINDSSRARILSTGPNYEAAPGGYASPMKRGGQVKNFAKGDSMESKAMVKKEVGFMKKKGAPASMIKHEMAEMKGMKKGGMMRAKKDIAADQMAMAPYKKGGAMARGGGIESRGKTKGTMVKMAAGGFVRQADGIAQRGKTKGTQVKMNKGGYC